MELYITEYNCKFKLNAQYMRNNLIAVCKYIEFLKGKLDLFSVDKMTCTAYLDDYISRPDEYTNNGAKCFCDACRIPMYAHWSGYYKMTADDTLQFIIINKPADIFSAFVLTAERRIPREYVLKIDTATYNGESYENLYKQCVERNAH